MERPTPMEVDASSANKQAYVAQLVQRFFGQLTRGCGRPVCTNPHCASNPSASRQAPNDAAKLAVQLVQRADASQLLCTPYTPPSAPTPMAVSEPNQPITPAAVQAERTNFEPARTSLPVTINSSGVSAMSTSPVAASRSASSPVGPSLLDRKPDPPVVIDVDDIQELVATAMSTGDYTPLIRRVGQIFSKHENLVVSFVTGPANMQSPGVDAAGINQCFDLLLNLPNVGAQKSLINALEGMSRGLKIASIAFSAPEQLRPILFMLQFPSLWETTAYHKTLLVPMCSAIGALPRSMQDYLISWWQQLSNDEFRGFVHRVQNFITIRITTSSVQALNRDEAVTAATKVMYLLNAVNEVRHVLPFTDFYNEMVNEHYDEREDFINWKRGGGFSFCNYPFILEAGTKGAVLTFESRVTQEHERRQAWQRSLMNGEMEVPVLIFKIRRQHLLSDSVRELANKSPEDLRKELRVHFVGEEALDEGGVQKEWFQLVVRQLFDPNFGMFTLDATTHNYWFNAASQDFNELRLIGKMIGLALYNGVILDIHFPSVVFKKMMGLKPELADVKGFNPGLYNGLIKLLNYPGNVEEDIGHTFQVSYEVFGETKHHALKPGGEAIAVTNANRQEYVELYVQWLLDASVSQQFGAFLNGFKTVCDSPAFALFRPEELELCVCGQPELDFEALEKATHYESYTGNDQVVRWFWEIVHAYPVELKKKLLFFTTGSDRAPPGGLGKLRFIIQRAGGDSDRLPESHTCFNHLMLPEYTTKKKLEDLLGKALNHAEGFGMR